MSLKTIKPYTQGDQNQDYVYELIFLNWIINPITCKGCSFKNFPCSFPGSSLFPKYFKSNIYIKHWYNFLFWKYNDLKLRIPPHYLSTAFETKALCTYSVRKHLTSNKTRQLQDRRNALQDWVMDWQQVCDSSSQRSSQNCASICAEV